MRILSATRARASVRALIALLVVTLLWVPTAIRATQAFKGSTSTLRLNRGFDKPADKQSLPQANEPVTMPAAVAHYSPAATTIQRRAVPSVDAIPTSPEFTVPDPLRGPPVVA